MVWEVICYLLRSLRLQKSFQAQPLGQNSAEHLKVGYPELRLTRNLKFVSWLLIEVRGQTTLSELPQSLHYVRPIGVSKPWDAWFLRNCQKTRSIYPISLWPEQLNPKVKSIWASFSKDMEHCFMVDTIKCLWEAYKYNSCRSIAYLTLFNNFPSSQNLWKRWPTTTKTSLVWP